MDKFLKEAVSMVVGKASEDIADLLNSKKHVNEFLISKKMEITINQTRNLLYKLSEKGIVSSIRKKDKRKGWYTYFWKIEIAKTLAFIKNSTEKRKQKILEQLNNRKTKQYYICERCNIEFDEAKALLMDFTCNECGGIFTLEDNTKLIKDLSRNLEKYDLKISEINVEVEKEAERLGKIREKEEAKKALEKAQKRAAKKKERDRLAKKEKKKLGKAVKKKVAKKKKIKKKSVKQSTKIKKNLRKEKVKKNLKKSKKKVVKKKFIKKPKKKIKKKSRK